MCFARGVPDFDSFNLVTLLMIINIVETKRVPVNYDLMNYFRLDQPFAFVTLSNLFTTFGF